jgi:hypothetical protein
MLLTGKEEEEELPPIVRISELEEGSWAEEFTNHPRWARSGVIPEEEREEESRCRLESKWNKSGEKLWNSIEDRIIERHLRGREEFKRVRKLKNHGAYVDLKPNNPLLPTPEKISGKVNWKIGRDPREGPTRGSAEWTRRKDDCWKAKATYLLGIKRREASNGGNSTSHI